MSSPSVDLDICRLCFTTNDGKFSDIPELLTIFELSGIAVSIKSGISPDHSPAQALHLPLSVYDPSDKPEQEYSPEDMFQLSDTPRIGDFTAKAHTVHATGLVPVLQPVRGTRGRVFRGE